MQWKCRVKDRIGYKERGPELLEEHSYSFHPFTLCSGSGIVGRGEIGTSQRFMAFEPRFLLHCTTDSASKSRFFRSSCHEIEKGNKIAEMEETSFHVLIVLWHVCVDVGKHPQNQN